MTSYGIQFRLPVATIDGLTIAVILCEASGRHFGLFLTRDDRGKDPRRPRYFVGCDYKDPRRGSESFLARMCDLGGNLYNLTFRGKRVEASWRTIYIIPTASDLDSESVTSPNLLINCNPLSRFRLPRWLVDRFIALGFDVDEYIYTPTCHVVGFVQRSAGFHRIFVCLGTCTVPEHHDPDTPAPLWAKLSVTLTRGSPEEFRAHDCAEDHLDSESWASRSKVFGDANNTVRLSFRSLYKRVSALSDTTPVQIHLELPGSALEDAQLSFPSLADIKRNSPRPTLGMHLPHRPNLV